MVVKPKDMQRSSTSSWVAKLATSCKTLVGKVQRDQPLCASYEYCQLPCLGTFSDIYRVIQEKRSVFWEVIISLSVRKNVRVNMRLILSGYQERAVCISRPNSVRFLLVGLDEERSLQNKSG
jgi:hypothetical protein